MEKNIYGGKFIVFEGLDGSGQSTQAALLKEYFGVRGRKALLTKEPTPWTAAGQKIQATLDEKIKLAPLKLQELFCEDRREHLEKEIIPALKDGKVVVCDRYFFSTIAFGGIDLSIEKLKQMNDGFIYPDIIFFLDVRPEICLERIGKRGEGFKFFEKLEKLKKVAENYRELTKSFSDVIIMDGEREIQEIHKKIISEIENNERRD
jgi:dTMP kinase